MKTVAYRTTQPERPSVSWVPILTLLLLLLTTYGYFFPRWGDWNQNSRIDLVMSLVDHGTLAIDRYVSNTGDYAHYQGHYYSDKAPGMALLGVPVYAAYRVLISPIAAEPLFAAGRDSSALAGTLKEDGLGLTTDRLNAFLALVLVSFTTVAIPSAAVAFLVYLMAGCFGLSQAQSWIAAALYGLATSAFPYSNSFVGHQTSAFLLFAAFVLLFFTGLNRIPRASLPLPGLLIGYAAITEYPTVLIGALLAVWALVVLGRPLDTALRLFIGALPPLLLLAAYDWVAFGTPLPVGYGHSSLWSEVHGIGFMSVTYPHWDALLGLTFGSYRGLFFLSPFLLFALPGYLLWRRNTGLRELWVLIFAPLLLLLFYSSSAMWQGGFAVGPRYLVSVLPFLALAAAVGMAACWRSLWLRPAIVLAVMWSLLAVWAETIAGQSFPDYTPNPLWNLSLPRLAGGDIARNAGMILGLSGWTSLLPLLVVDLFLVLATFLRFAGVGKTAVARGYLPMSLPTRGNE